MKLNELSFTSSDLAFEANNSRHSRPQDAITQSVRQKSGPT